MGKQQKLGIKTAHDIGVKRNAYISVQLNIPIENYNINEHSFLIMFSAFLKTGEPIEVYFNEERQKYGVVHQVNELREVMSNPNIESSGLKTSVRDYIYRRLRALNGITS